MSRGYAIFSQLGRYGRFANGIFQVASTIGIARRNALDYKFPLWINHDHRDRFGSPEDVDIYKHLADPLPLWTGEPYPERYVQWGYEDVTLHGNTDLLGHMQSESYFAHCIDEVRARLTFKGDPGPLDYCAVHWRAGDYQQGGKGVYHPRMDEDYYYRALEHIPKEQRLFVFSDDWDAATLMFDKIGDQTGRSVVIIRPEYNYIESFKVMKSCHSFICANSSYSLVAAILANQPGKKVICPALWFGEPAGGLKMDYPKNSIVI